MLQSAPTCSTSHAVERGRSGLWNEVEVDCHMGIYWDLTWTDHLRLKETNIKNMNAHMYMQIFPTKLTSLVWDGTGHLELGGWGVPSPGAQLTRTYVCVLHKQRQCLRSSWNRFFHISLKLPNEIIYYHTLMRAWYSSFSLCTHISPSLGPALVFNNGILARFFFVTSSTMLNFHAELF